MKAVIQRVTEARVVVGERTVASIGTGLVVLLGVGKSDSEKDGNWLAAKVAGLRIFQDEGGKMNRSVLECSGQVLVVSQFTLYGDCRKGMRPGFDQAAPPEQAEHLYESFVARLRGLGVAVQTGIFRANMQVGLTNDGPVTILLESPSNTG